MVTKTCTKNENDRTTIGPMGVRYLTEWPIYITHSPKYCRGFDRNIENNGLKETAEQYGMEVDEFVKQIGSKELFKYDLLMRKAMKVVTE